MRTRKTKNNKIAISDFYCTKCGQKGISLARKSGHAREAGHLKKLWCPNCNVEVNFVEVRPFGSYNYDDFVEEFDLGRFVDGQRIAIADLMSCSNEKCKDCFYNVNGRCWNANHSYDCEVRREEV